MGNQVLRHWTKRAKISLLPASGPFLLSEDHQVLTEQEVARSWRKLFKAPVAADAFAKAEELLEELRPESPLRHRLGSELEELRELATSKN